MAQLTITTTRSVVISGLPEELTAAEQQEIVDNVARLTRFDEEELDNIALDLDLSGDWKVVEQVQVGDPMVTETIEE